MIIGHFLPHDLDPTQARALVEAAFGFYRSRYPRAKISLAWNSDETATVGFGARGFSFHGTVLLRPGGIELELELPFVFRVFHKQALRVVDAEAKKWLERARSGSLP